VVAKRDNRGEVLAAAKHGGWAHKEEPFDSGNILRDTFSGIPGIVSVVWIRTPWKESGRFAGAVFSDRIEQRDRNLWSIRGKNSLIERLLSQ